MLPVWFVSPAATILSPDCQHTNLNAAQRQIHAALSSLSPCTSAALAACPPPLLPQVVVALMESLQEGGAVCGAAVRALDELVTICRRTHRDKLRLIPPLPNWLPELQALNEVGGMGGRVGWRAGGRVGGWVGGWVLCSG